jgi:dTDP-4-amino-4,6-dideoxygalactose transaminase
LLAKLTIFEDEIRLRRLVARRYTERLSGLVETPAQMQDTDSIWAQYTIKLPNRDAVADRLRQQGIPTQIYYPLPMHLQPAYARHGGGKGSLPVSEQLSREVLALPMHPYLDETATNTICSALREAMRAI